MKFVVFLFLGIMMHATTAAAEDIPAGDAAHGKTIYESICIHCHKLTDEKSAVGAPGFKDVTKRHTPAWLNQWIKGPEAFAKVDATAKKLMDGNTMGVKMPSFPEMQTDQNRYDVIEFLKTL
jgi:cytochrome c2